jgi:hypothetical protein
VGQFHIGNGELWLIALAKNDADTALSISAGVLSRRRLKRAA